MGDKISELEKKIKKVEAELLEQEHRPFKLLWNYFNRKRKWKENDVRRKAVSKAIIWRFLFSPTSIAFGGGAIVALGTLYFLYNQNELFKIQNIRMEQQTHLIEASRRSSQMFIMGEVLSDINTELNDSVNNKERILSNTLVGRIISLSRAMKPYRFLDGDSLIKKPISPERGQLLISLIESKIDSAFFIGKILRGSDFNYADLSDADMYNAYLMGADLSYANLSGVLLYNADLSDARFSDADMYNADLSDAELSHAELSHANLSYAYLSHANLSHAYLNATDLRFADLSFSNLRFADLMGANLEAIYSLDSVRVHRSDWLIYIKDSLNLRGSEEIYNDYRVDSVYYYKDSKEKLPMLIRKETNQ